jgi:hypothetical protein
MAFWARRVKEKKPQNSRTRALRGKRFTNAWKELLTGDWTGDIPVAVGAIRPDAHHSEDRRGRDAPGPIETARSFPELELYNDLR